jgi:hypothetical protein
VLPEHIHLLVSELAMGTPSTVIQVLKQRVSRRLRRKKRKPSAQFTLNFQNTRDSLPRFWQSRFYDFNVFEPGEKSRKASLHAHESAETKIGRPSERLALEQFFLLLESQRIDSRRPVN